jgi:hypothetical protein
MYFANRQPARAVQKSRILDIEKPLIIKGFSVAEYRGEVIPSLTACQTDMGTDEGKR